MDHHPLRSRMKLHDAYLRIRELRAVGEIAAAAPPARPPCGLRWPDQA
jgi:hypothetical protein